MTIPPVSLETVWHWTFRYCLRRSAGLWIAEFLLRGFWCRTVHRLWCLIIFFLINWRRSVWQGNPSVLPNRGLHRSIPTNMRKSVSRSANFLWRRAGWRKRLNGWFYRKTSYWNISIMRRRFRQRRSIRNWWNTEGWWSRMYVMCLLTSGMPYRTGRTFFWRGSLGRWRIRITESIPW